MYHFQFLNMQLNEQLYHNLYHLFQKHPDGQPHDDTSPAVVSLKPRLRAALSHVALSVIPTLPGTESQLPLATCEYATE